ncbi:hypothetical protein G1K37_10450 [Tenacibaculum dicentrarchi]|nr:hypothetical protein [Tenacibaculum dicentrarchi]
MNQELNQEQRELLIKKIETEHQFFHDAIDSQLNLNDKIDKIITWLIGFVFIFIGILFSNLNKICFKHIKCLIFLLSITILFGILSRTFSYLFGLSFISNINHLKRVIIEIKTNTLDELTSKYFDKITKNISLFNLKSKNKTRKNLNLYKNLFVWSSVTTLVFFILSLIALVFNIILL